MAFARSKNHRQKCASKSPGAFEGAFARASHRASFFSYPLPEITWYKDDVLLKEDERRTFYADDDGFFAMTIDPVQVSGGGGGSLTLSKFKF